jgi:hypothetical protein
VLRDLVHLPTGAARAELADVLSEATIPHAAPGREIAVPYGVCRRQIYSLQTGITRW